MLFDERMNCTDGSMQPEMRMDSMHYQPPMMEDFHLREEMPMMDDYYLREDMPMMDDDRFTYPMTPTTGRDSCFCPKGPIMEPPYEKCVTRDICHDVPHICPIHTRIINNHICRHTYVPRYTCSEQNVVSHVHLGSCCDFPK